MILLIDGACFDTPMLTLIDAALCCAADALLPIRSAMRASRDDAATLISCRQMPRRHADASITLCFDLFLRACYSFMRYERYHATP